MPVLFLLQAAISRAPPVGFSVHPQGCPLASANCGVLPLPSSAEYDEHGTKNVA
jgi:hypothetical protein